MDQASVENPGQRKGLRREGLRRWPAWSRAREKPTGSSNVQTPLLQERAGAEGRGTGGQRIRNWRYGGDGERNRPLLNPKGAGRGWGRCISGLLASVSSQFVQYAAAAAAKSLQSCPTLCDPIDGSPPGSPVPGIHQARTLEWPAISFSNA